MTAQNSSQKEILLYPDVPEREQPVITSAELKKILFEFNNTARDYPSDKCIHQLFEEQVELTPDAIAVVFEQQELTYQSLNQKANLLAHYLQKVGVKPEILVGLFVERSIEMLIGLLGILKAGGAYVPLDPNYPGERIAYMVSDALLSVVVTQHHLIDLLPASGAKVVCLDHDSSIWKGESHENPAMGVSPENLAYVIYTSGSTGLPKGVMIEHRSVVNVTQAAKVECQISSGESPTGTLRERVLQFASISFDVAVQEIYPYLTTGGTVVLRTEQMLSSNSTFVQKCWEWKLTVLNLPPAFWHQLITELAATKQSLPPSLRIVMIGGERALPEKLKLWQEYIQEMLHSHKLVEPPQLYNCYGPTEATVDATYCDLSSYNISEDTLSSVPIGRPIANSQIYILDPELQPVAIGVKGELHIGGMGLARGYLNRPELTTEKFIPNPFNNSVRLYKTGDLCRWLPDGNIEYCDRIDNQVKVRGFRIELGEIESVLEQHPAIGQAVVIPQEDQLGDKRLVAYVLVNPGSKNGQLIPEWRSFLKEKLPDYMTPAAFVILEKLPLTPNDKVDRKALAQLPVNSDIFSSPETFVAPRTPEEEILAGIWADVLGLERVGIHDNFFDLGGHSLKVAALCNKLLHHFGRSFTIGTVFQASTVAEFAVYLRENHPELIEKIECKAEINTFLQEEYLPSSSEPSPIGYFPVSFTQERRWFYQKLNPNSCFWSNLRRFRLTGELNVEALAESFNEIIRRHQILRTTFCEVNGSPMQMVVSDTTINLSVVDLQTLPETVRTDKVETLTQEIIGCPFDQANGPLLRVTLIQWSEQSYILLVYLNDMIIDDSSFKVLFKELSLLYEALVFGKPSPLPALPIQYIDYVQWQRQSLTPQVLETKLNYWKQWFAAGEPPVLQLSIDKLPSSVPTLRGADEFYQLSMDLTQKLKTLSQQNRTTLFMTVLTAFATLLYNYSGCEDIVIGSPRVNRNHWKLEPLIGVLSNMMMLRIDLGDNPNFLELLAQVRQVVLAALAHQDIPFEQVAKFLQPEPKRSNPFFRMVITFLPEPPDEELKLPNLTVACWDMEEFMSRPDLELAIWEEKSASGTFLKGVWQYKKDLFARDTIAGMTKNFLALLEAIVANPEQSVIKQMKQGIFSNYAN